MKKFLLTLTGIMLSCYVMAQIGFTNTAPGTLTHKPHTSTPAAQQAPRRIQLADNQVIMGAYTSDDYITSTNSSYGLPNYPGTLKMGQIIPAEALAIFNGSKIVQMRVAFTVAPGQSQFFIAPVTADGQVKGNIFQQNVSKAKAGWNLVTLDTPYEINTEAISGIMLGFSYKQLNTNDGYYYNDECYPLSIVQTGESYPIKVSGINGSSEWYDFMDGALSVQAIVEGNFPNVAVRPLNFGSILVPFGKSVEKAVKIRNVGKKAVRNVSYTITTNGTTSSERTVQLPSSLSNFNGTAEIDVTFPSSASEGTERRIITITKVNGVPNGSDIQSAYGMVTSTSKTLTRRSVVEEYTGTGCGWCPRGIVGMENMRKKFGDKFIGIALHQFNGSDAMYLSGDKYAPLSFSGAPSCIIDRSGTSDPYYGAASAVEYMLTQPTKVAIEVEASWTSDGRNVKATSSTISLIDGASFNIEYVLVADGLSGNTTSWAQANYYSSQLASSTGLSKSSIESDLRFLWDEGTSYYPTFNDVAVCSSYEGGVNQATPLQNLSSDEPTTNSFTLTVPNKLLSAVKKGKVYVVALVIDDDGTITNAAKCEVGKYGTGIIAAEAEHPTSNQAVFSVDGRRLRSTQKGINIVRMSDGSVRKVLQK